jgi:hypothetical protein
VSVPHGWSPLFPAGWLFRSFWSTSGIIQRQKKKEKHVHHNRRIEEGGEEGIGPTNLNPSPDSHDEEKYAPSSSDNSLSSFEKN